MKYFSRRIILALWLMLFVLSGPVSARGDALDAGKHEPGVKKTLGFVPEECEILNQKVLNQDKGSKLRNLSPPMRVLLGLLVPGLPQFFDGKIRSYGYFAVEGAGVAGLVLLTAKGSSHEKRYLNLARAARGNFLYPGFRNNPEEETNPMLPGFGEYYEDLLKWPSSGDFDNDPSRAGVQPETDPRTYNGHQWEIAQMNNYSASSGGIPVPASPAEEQAALETYKRQVYPSQYNWDWTGLDEENDEYHRLFDKSEDAYRGRIKFTAILLANHLVSALDVLVAERINRNSFLKSSNLQIHFEMHSLQADSNGLPFPALKFSRRF
jgi:hypothetical protein